MGIFGLTNLVHDKGEVYGGVFYLNIIDEIRKYKMFNANKGPLIIFDYSALQHIQGNTDVELLCGSRWKQIVDKIKHLMKSMVDEGADIVFFLEAPTQPEQEQNWMTRKTNQYKDYCKVVQQVKEGNFSLTSNEKTSPVVHGPYLLQELRQFGTWIPVFETNVDLRIAQFARKERALAIFTDDSDFLIFEGYFRLWKIREINFETLTTKELSRCNLRKALKLGVHQMPLFATLAGNDVLHRFALEKFHAKCPAGHNKFKWIAELIRHFPAFRDIKEYDIKTLSKLVGCSPHLICLSLRQVGTIEHFLLLTFLTFFFQYDLRYRPPCFLEQDSLLKKLQNHNHQILYIILKGLSKRIGPMYEDEKNVEFKRSQSGLLLHLYRCSMGVLLQNEKDCLKKRLVYTVVCCHDGYEKIHVEPIYPVLPTTSLTDLILNQNDKELDAKRFDLLKWAVKCPKLNIEELVKVEPVFVPIIVTLCFLTKEKKMTTEEADLFLFCYYDAVNNLIPDVLEIPTEENFNFRIFQVTWTFIQVQESVVNFLACIGFDKFTVYTAFDGVYLQNMCKVWTEANEDVKQECLKDIKIMRLYSNM